jgi:predicted nucleic acid-binding protein
MTVFVVDASFVGSLFLPDENSESAMALIASARAGKHSLVTNHLWWYEMTD